MLNFDIIPIDNTVTVRKTKWVVPCPNCQCERYVTYCQAYNIKIGKSLQECFTCRIELGKQTINMTGLTLGRKYHNNSRQGVESKYTFYYNLFNNPAKKDDVKSKMRNAKLNKFGESSNRWDNGKTELNSLIRRRDVYKQWRLSVFERDNYTCQKCYKVGGKLNAHHIKKFSEYIELRTDINNGITLCIECHRNEHRRICGIENSI